MIYIVFISVSAHNNSNYCEIRSLLGGVLVVLFRVFVLCVHFFHFVWLLFPFSLSFSFWFAFFFHFLSRFFAFVPLTSCHPSSQPPSARKSIRNFFHSFFHSFSPIPSPHLFKSINFLFIFSWFNSDFSLRTTHMQIRCISAQIARILPYIFCNLFFILQNSSVLCVESTFIISHHNIYHNKNPSHSMRCEREKNHCVHLANNC